MRLSFTLFSVITLVVALPGQSTTAPTTTRDSANITLINAGIDAVPLLSWRIGAARVRAPGDAEPFYQVTGLTMISGPTMLVADHGALRVRRFAASGDEAPSWGRSGEGPGEFRSITSIGRGTADSVWVHDMVLARLNLFDRNGRSAGTIGMPPTGGAFGEVIGMRGPQVIGVSLPAIHAGMAEGLRRDSLEIYPVGRSGERGRRVAVVPGRDQMVRIRSSARGISVSKSALPFGFGPLYGMSGSGVVVGGTEHYRLRLHDLNGRVTAIVAVAVPRNPVAGPLLEAWAAQEAAAAGSPDRAVAIARSARSLPLHQFAPELSALVTDLTGGFWVRRFVPLGATHAPWVVHAADGTPIGRLTLPARWEVREIGRDYLLAVERNADEEEDVLWVPLVRS